MHTLLHCGAYSYNVNGVILPRLYKTSALIENPRCFREDHSKYNNFFITVLLIIFLDSTAMNAEQNIFVFRIQRNVISERRYIPKVCIMMPFYIMSIFYYTAHCSTSRYWRHLWWGHAREAIFHLPIYGPKTQYCRVLDGEKKWTWRSNEEL